jgi:hypothetical protein
MNGCPERFCLAVSTTAPANRTRARPADNSVTSFGLLIALDGLFHSGTTAIFGLGGVRVRTTLRSLEA